MSVRGGGGGGGDGGVGGGGGGGSTAVIARGRGVVFLSSLIVTQAQTLPADLQSHVSSDWGLPQFAFDELEIRSDGSVERFVRRFEFKRVVPDDPREPQS